MGAGNGVQPNNAALAGTVKDCQGRLIQGATVGFTRTPTHYGYFNANVSNLLPNTAATYTSPDATYAAVNIPAEAGCPVKVRALVKIDGEIVVAGERSVQPVPQSVIICAFRFGNPINYPQITW